MSIGSDLGVTLYSFAILQCPQVINALLSGFIITLIETDPHFGQLNILGIVLLTVRNTRLVLLPNYINVNKLKTDKCFHAIFLIIIKFF